MKIPERYTAGVDKTERLKELKERRESKKPLSKLFPKKTDKEAIKKGIVKPSPFTTKFKKEFGDIPFDKPAFSKRFKIPLKTLDEVYDRGIAAWRSSGSRAGVPAQAWAIARTYRLILVWTGKIPAPKNDPDSSLWENRPKN
jgi:hypothetical protein